MKLLIDMNLTPRWISVLANVPGGEVVHWPMVGDAKAKDSHITEWARQHGYWILTNDLDFSQLRAPQNHPQQSPRGGKQQNPETAVDLSVPP
jgi:predicted nuclease of predicted toxin-antitoxin system